MTIHDQELPTNFLINNKKKATKKHVSETQIFDYMKIMLKMFFKLSATAEKCYLVFTYRSKEMKLLNAS